MGINMETAKKAEVIARRLAKEAGQGALWEMFLVPAYDELVKQNKEQ